MPIEIRALRRDDDRASFRSGDAALDLFFERHAGQDQWRHHVGVTYVAVDGRQILGFATVSPASLDAETLPDGRRRPPYPVPVLRIARLAVASSVQGLGIGRGLLRFCIEIAERMRDEAGCVGVVVDAKRGAEAFYAALGFLRVEALQGAAAVVPSPVLMFLPLGRVPRRST